MELTDLRWDERGLLPVVIQDATSGSVLTLAHANLTALAETLRTKQTVLFSRSRNALWRKGETSGNTQTVQSVSYDCDADALLYQVIPQGPACHTGEASCFHKILHGTNQKSNDFALALLMLQDVLRARKASAPPDSYVGKLFRGGPDAICKKIGEEAAEVIIAAKNSDDSERIWEASDLLFHLLVLLELQDIPLERIGAELLRRHHQGS